MSTAFYTVLLMFLPVFQDQDESVNLLKYKGITHLRTSSYDSAIYYFDQAIEKATSSGDFKSIAESYNNIGVAFYYQNQFKESIDNYLIALDYYDRTKNDTLIAESRHNMGLTYKRFGLYERAQESLISAAKQFEKLGMKKNLSSTFNSLGNIHRDLKNFDLAFTYLNDALSLRREINYEFGVAQSLHNLGNWYFEIDSLDQAISFYKRAYEIKRVLGQNRSLANTLSKLGESYILKDSLNQALNSLERALTLRRNLNDEGGMGIAYNHLGLLFLTKKELNKSRAYLDSARAKLEVKNLVTDLAYNFEIKRQFFLESNRYDSAYWYANGLSQLKEKILNEEKARALIEAEIKYDVFKKEIEIEKQKQSLTLLKSQMSLWIVLFILMSILTIVIIRLLRNSKRENSRVENLLKEMNHRTQNHLESLAGIIELQQVVVEDFSAKEVLRGMSDRTRAISLIHKSLYTSLEGSKEEIRLAEYVRNVCNNLNQVYSSPAMVLNLSLDLEEIDLDLHKALPVGIILNELVTNSFKYGKGSNKEINIDIHLRKSKEEITIKVSDQGPGKSQIRQANRNTSGGKIIAILVDQLKADWSEEYDNGLVSQISFRD